MQRMERATGVRGRVAVLLGALVVLIGAGARQPVAASSKGCVGGGFTLVGQNGMTISGEVDRAVPAATLGSSFLVRGRFVVLGFPFPFPFPFPLGREPADPRLPLDP